MIREESILDNVAYMTGIFLCDYKSDCGFCAVGCAFNLFSGPKYPRKSVKMMVSALLGLFILMLKLPSNVI